MENKYIYYCETMAFNIPILLSGLIATLRGSSMRRCGSNSFGSYPERPIS